MGIHAQLLDKQPDMAKQRERVDELEANQQESTEEDRDDEGQDLVVGQRATEDTDSDEAGTE